MPEITCDIFVIGSGPGGYVAAIRAAQLGNKVAIAEKDSWGGVCLNWGCIPTKALLFASELFHLIDIAREYGIQATVSGFSLDTLRQKKEKVVKQLVGGVEFLLKGNQITALKGAARFLNPRQVEVSTDGQKTLINARKTIIATGTEPVKLPILPVDGDLVIDSQDALDLKRIPKKIAIIGAGAIGIEFADIYRAFGSQVVVIELLDSILPVLDKEVAGTLANILRKRGIEIYTGHKVTGAKLEKSKAALTVEPAAGAAPLSLECDMVLVAVGLRGLVAGLDLEKVGVAADQHGFIQINGRLETNVPDIYAIGDVVGGKLLAHKASHEGIVAAEAASARKVEMDYRVVPYAVFTDPEIGAVGLTEEEARTQGYKVKIGRFPFRALGKAIGISRTEGFVKIIGDAETDELLGMHIIGAHAGDLIAEGAMAMSLSATCEDVAATIHVHPTLAEAVMEAALDADQRVIHLISKK